MREGERGRERQPGVRWAVCSVFPEPQMFTEKRRARAGWLGWERHCLIIISITRSPPTPSSFSSSSSFYLLRLEVAFRRFSEVIKGTIGEAGRKGEERVGRKPGPHLSQHFFP